MLNLLENQPDLLNANETAEILNCTPATVCKLCRSGQLHALKTGKSWMIPRISLTDYILYQSGYKTTS